MTPERLRLTVQKAADKIYYPQCLEYIEANLQPEFHSLARATLVYYLPTRIADLPTLQERRAAVASIPKDAEPDHTLDFVKSAITQLFAKGRRKAG
tara:strand:- start:392 stop:679 length:288 start_codon:yes stop_codon:yes gene_type:complete